MAAGDPDRDLYDVLGVVPGASPAQITSAYRRRLRDLHPDSRPPGSDPGADGLGDVLSAYQVLHDPEQRASYDARRRRPAGGQAVGGVVIPVRHVDRADASGDDLLRGVGPTHVDAQPPPDPRHVDRRARPARDGDLLDLIEALLRGWW